ncbi:FlgO family outer membrane protein [Magnetococcales bacterium HHB-1]
MKRKVKTLALLGLFSTVIILAGCSQTVSPYPMISQPMTERAKTDLGKQTYRVADAMVRNLGDMIPARLRILPVSFVDQNNLEKTSALGRRLSSQISSRLSQHGYSMVEIKLRSSILMKKKEGTFMLSRDMEKIRKKHDVQAILSGHYVVSRSRVEVTAQIVRLSDQVVLTSFDFSLPKDGNVRALLGDKSLF